MKSHMQDVLRGFAPILVCLLAGVACNLPTVLESTNTPATTTVSPTDQPPGGEQGAALAGEYFCMGHEAGMLAAAATLELRPDGRAVDAPPPSIGGDQSTGTWRYLPEQRRVEFEGELDLDYGQYSPGSGLLVVYLKSGTQRAHADGGTMTCERR